MYSCLLLLLLTSNSNHICHCLQSVYFVRIENAAQSDVVYVTNESPSVVLDATAAFSRVVYFANRASYIDQELKFSCAVNRQSLPLKSISFCCRRDRYSSDRPCNRIPEKRAGGIVSCHGVDFKYESHELNGANFSIVSGSSKHSATPRSAVNGIFSCSITDSTETVISSNEIELRDVVFYTSQLSTVPSSVVKVLDPIKKDEFPHTFECTPSSSLSKEWPDWLNTIGESSNIYEWKYCEFDESPNSVICSERSQPIPSDACTTFLNGTMFLLDPTFLDRGNRGNLAIQCSAKQTNSPVITFAGGIDGPQPVPKITKGLTMDAGSMYSPALTPMTKLHQNFTLFAGSNLRGFFLRAVYREPRDGSTFRWYKDGEPLPSKGATKFHYQMPLTADSELGGTYELKITSISNSNDVLIFTYSVTVVAPPKFTTDCLSGLFFVMKGTNYKSVCQFKSRSPPKVRVGVYQHEAETAEELRSILSKRYLVDHKLSILNIDFSTSSQRVEVNVYSLQTEQDFELSIHVENEYGGSHLQSALKVVPLPKLTVAPDTFNCVQDCDTKPYNVSCELNTELLHQWLDQFEITPVVTWVVQNQWSSEQFDSKGLLPFFGLPESDGSVLSVWPEGNTAFQSDTPRAESESVDPAVATMRTLKQFIAENSEESAPEELILLCRIRLIVNTPEAGFDGPLGERLIRNARQPLRGALRSGPNHESRVIYDSNFEKDTTLVDHLTAKRTFTSDPQPATASLAWIAAVVIGALIIVIVIVLSVWLYTRDRGETYKLYEKERAHGNDPIQEIKDTEVFKTYQRQEEQPIASSRFSLNDESMHVGSDEEGELFQYGANAFSAVKPDFNEEGSFIHGYSTDPALPKPLIPHRSDLPPLVGQRASGQNHTAV